MFNEKYNLNWNEFGSSTVETFKELLSDEEFTDVTLACDDDKQIKAHKAILCSSSTFFKRILKKNPHQHPLVYLKGINQESLQSIVQFIYLGQTEVAQDNLDIFMTAAKELEIRGLTENNMDDLPQPLHEAENKTPQKKVFSTERNVIAHETSYESIKIEKQPLEANFVDFGLNF